MLSECTAPSTDMRCALLLSQQQGTLMSGAVITSLSKEALHAANSHEVKLATELLHWQVANKYRQVREIGQKSWDKGWKC